MRKSIFYDHMIEDNFRTLSKKITKFCTSQITSVRSPLVKKTKSQEEIEKNKHKNPTLSTSDRNMFYRNHAQLNFCVSVFFFFLIHSRKYFTNSSLSLLNYLPIQPPEQIPQTKQTTRISPLRI